jgi:hypothetical protein
VGADRILYGSLFPFLIGDMKRILSKVDAFPAAQRDANSGKNQRSISDL